MRPAVALAAILAAGAITLHAQAGDIQFVFSADAHYGITRTEFQGHTDVPAQVVNASLVQKANSLSGATFPKDGGLREGQAVGPFDFFIEGGDVANREEGVGAAAIQSASTSWWQFVHEYIDGLKLPNRTGGLAPVYVVPGNHEASNAVGFYRPMTPAIDMTPLVEIYNRMVAPAVARTTTTYDYARDKVMYSRDIGGVHFMFIMIWPDSQVRAWMERDLAGVSPSTPAIVFTHDQPDAEAKHFRNPNGLHDINGKDAFENLLSDTFADGTTTSGESTIEQGALEDFLRKHPNLTAYFHGNSNWNQFYDWTGPKHTIALHTFRVDSPMKGAISSQDERKLSFQVATIDMRARTMTVRECLWNADPQHPASAAAWGGSTTVALSPRP
jgi:hypothetical protein